MTRPVSAVLVSVSFVVGLAALLRMADPAATGDDLTGVIRLPSTVVWTVATLFAAAALVIVLDVARRLRSRRHGEDDDVPGAREEPRRQPWLQALTQLGALANVIVLAYLLWTNVAFRELMGLTHGLAAPGAAAAAPAPDAPALVTWSYALLALLAGAAALAFALWLVTGDRLAAWATPDDEEPATPPPLARAVDDSLEDLRAEPDARRAIIRSYARFERAAAASGLERRPWQTPMEFMRDALARLPAPTGSVRALTGLFELARFSARPLGAAERDRALDALDAIKAGVEQREARDAVSS